MLSEFFVRIEEANAHWQLGLFAVAFGLCWVLLRERPSIWAFAFLAAFASSIALFNAFVFIPKTEQVLRFNAFNLGVNWQMVVYLSIAVAFALRYGDLTTKLLAGAVWIGETFGVALSSYCNLISEDSRTFEEIEAKVATGASDYACGRVVSHFFEFLPVIVELMVMALIVYVFVPRRRT